MASSIVKCSVSACYSITLMALGFFIAFLVFRKRLSTPHSFETSPKISLLDNGDGKIVQVALAYAQSAGPYVGVQGDIAVWKPQVELDDTSLNVVGCWDEDIAIYAGYGVSYAHFGDLESRLFLGTSIFGKNCLNNANCSGFVQVDFTHNLNDIVEISNYDDTSKHKNLHVSIDRDNGPNGELGWWISFNSTRMGYIRKDMFPNMLCKQVLWGGILYTHAKLDFTEMGNGHFPSNGLLKTGEITFAVSTTKDKTYIIEQDKKKIVTSPGCYDLQILEGGDHFLYGGSGSLNFEHCT